MLRRIHGQSCNLKGPIGTGSEEDVSVTLVKIALILPYTQSSPRSSHDQGQRLGHLLHVHSCIQYSGKSATDERIRTKCQQHG